MPTPTLNGAIHPIGAVSGRFSPTIETISCILAGRVRPIIDISAVPGIFVF
jgi:hypothetical protein